MATLFTLEAVFAKKGDALLLHYGPFLKPKMILIDGGPGGVYTKFLKPRITQLRDELGLDDDDAFPLEMVMVSHIDDDHVNGILRLVNDNVKAKDRQRPAPYHIKTLWHNSFDDMLGNTRREIVSRMSATAASTGPGLPLPKMDDESKAVVAGVAQGRDLRNAAKKLRLDVNDPFQGMVMAPADKKISLGHGMKFTVVGPMEEQVVALRKKWKKDVKKILKKERNSARASSFADKSVANLASLCVLAEMKGKKILLTGDARGDFLLKGLEATKVLKKTKPLHVDILKVPHHGSDRNVTENFFERITADHYVFSGDGEHGNPDRGTLDMIDRARGNARYTMHFTVTRNAHRLERNLKRKKALKELMSWVRAKPDNVTVKFRRKKSDVFSLAIDLLDPLTP